MMTWKYIYDTGNLKRRCEENTESYILFTWKRYVVVDFDLYVRNIFLASVIFVRHTSLATMSYPADANDVSTIEDR